MNRLSKESSPYLLQHAHNPVDWYPWGDEALQKALAEDKPILVSIGYAACHWCHVMERESFEKEAVAGFMNEHFVNIKIDREERPDLDHIYMDALQAMTGSGGWPLNVFLTPDTRPFFGGTYFPPVNAHGRPSWMDTLGQVTRAYRERKGEVEARATQLTEHLSLSNAFGLQNRPPALMPGAELVSGEQLKNVYANLMQQADREYGGFGRPPKFPQTFSIQWLLHYAHFTGEKEALAHACGSLDHLLAGGIYDQLGGGMARYSTDRAWLVPHFEKMLYDNALLVSVLCEAYGLTREKRYGDAIREILGFVQREWETAEGGFYSAWDADSEGEEGKYYTWSREEVDELLGDDAALFCSVYDISSEGNWEGFNILHLPAPLHLVAEKSGLTREQLSSILQKSKERLLEARSKRIPPLLDDKQLLNWNALINKAFSQAYAVTGEPSYQETAVRHMQFLLRAFRPGAPGSNPLSVSSASADPAHAVPSFADPSPLDPAFAGQVGLGHAYKEGRLRYPAFLDDYAYLVQALLWLQEITGDKDYLLQAQAWVEYVIANFSEAETGFFYYTHENQKDILFRKKEVYDGAIPSGNAVMAWNLWYLSIALDRGEWRARAEAMLQAIMPVLGRHPSSFGVWADLALQAHYGWNEIAIVGDTYLILLPEVLREYIPNRVLQAAGVGDDHFPLLQGKGAGGETLIYLCRDYACGPPVADPEALVQQIRGRTQ